MNGVYRSKPTSKEITLLMLLIHLIILAIYTITKEIILRLWNTINGVYRFKFISKEKTQLMLP